MQADESLGQNSARNVKNFDNLRVEKGFASHQVNFADVELVRQDDQILFVVGRIEDKVVGQSAEV